MRTILKDRLLCDGTPCREKGFRAVVRTEGLDLNPRYPWPVPQVRFNWSPLFQTESEAADWQPDMDAILRVA